MEHGELLSVWNARSNESCPSLSKNSWCNTVLYSPRRSLLWFYVLCPDGFTSEEMLKLWKGLFYCLWMQDKPLLQVFLFFLSSRLLERFQAELWLVANHFFKLFPRPGSPPATPTFGTCPEHLTREASRRRILTDRCSLRTADSGCHVQKRNLCHLGAGLLDWSRNAPAVQESHNIPYGHHDPACWSELMAPTAI